MFDAIVDRYDLLNDAMSLGLVRGWRRAAAQAVRAPRPARLLDLGCGTGLLARELSAQADVVAVDVSEQMLRAAQARVASVAVVRGSAFRLPFADASFGGAASAFVLRNLDDLAGAFTELARVVAPGGSVALVDITEPRHAWFRRAFDLYFAVAAPALGAWFGHGRAYRYLVSSLAQLPGPAEVAALLERAGFEGCLARPLTGGLVTLWTGRRRRATDKEAR